MAFQFPRYQLPRVDHRYSALLHQSSHLQSLLTADELGNSAHFVVVNGAPISIEDMDRALHLEDVEGTLDPQEIQAIIWPELDDGSEQLWSLNQHFELYEDVLRKKLESARAKKKTGIERLVRNYLASVHGEIPRKDALLMAFSKGRLHFSDLSAYLASVAALNEEGVRAVEQTSREVQTALDPQSREISAKSTEPLGTALRSKQFEWFCKALGMPCEELVNLATVLVERALMEHPFETEDARQVFTYDRSQSGVNVPFSIETRVAVAGAVYTLPAFWVAVFLGASHPLGVPLLYSAAGGMATFFGMGVLVKSGFTPLSWAARRLAVAGKERRMMEGYEAAYQRLRMRFEEMKKTPLGRMKLIFLRMWLQSKVGTVPVEDEKLSSLWGRLQKAAVHKEAWQAFFEFHGDVYFENTELEQILTDFDQWPKE